MAFRIYKPYGDRAKKQLFVTISKNTIFLNKIAREKLRAGKIELAYDRDAKVIKISASPEGQPTRQRTIFYGRGFFNHFSIKKKGRFTAEYNADENALYVALEQNLR
ncbi:MAG: hypothetical protein A4E53_04381 [Pelotomaculum sp. PtaB.Bin104]|nr:MAG: hypothetical protein A4E53_04381 [Pelotomaculum sp. PtaB.Bin104]